MANHQHGEVDFEAGGETYTFRLGVNELINIQDALGLADDDARFLVALDNLRGFKQLRIVLYQGLRGRHPEITELEAGDVFTQIGFAKAAALIGQALRWALPEKEADEGKQKGVGKSRPSRGPTSS